jgi:hypothetical protein
MLIDCVLTPASIVGDCILDMQDALGGGWDGAFGEHTFQIIAPNGVEVGDYGLSPAAGEFTIDACLL